MASMALWLSGCGRLLGPKVTLGPGEIVRGRALYNDVITATNAEQTLDLIVRQRYGEASGLLSVSSVTTNPHATATTAGQFGIGPEANFSGNLVPLSLGLTYEESPTITYAPVQGERYAKALLSPVGLEMLVLLLGMERAPHQLISILVKQINGLQNPIFAPPAARAAFQESTALLARLSGAGQATWTSASTKNGAFALVIHDYAPGNREAVADLLRRWGLPASLARGDRDVVLPLILAVGTLSEPGLAVQTRSVYDLLEMAGSSVEAPPDHVARGLVDPGPDATSPLRDVLRIRSSRQRPSESLVAVVHHGYWFYIAANDGPSKLAFRLFQTLINMRLAEAIPPSLPTLTIPVK